MTGREHGFLQQRDRRRAAEFGVLYMTHTEIFRARGLFGTLIQMLMCTNKSRWNHLPNSWMGKTRAEGDLCCQATDIWVEVGPEK
jgi:hypothetical protein